MPEDDNEEEGSTYPDVDVTIRFTNSHGNPIEGLSVNLSTTWGFYDEQFTDTNGEVEFSIRSWQTYTLWVNHSKFNEIGVEGGNESFEFIWE